MIAKRGRHVIVDLETMGHVYFEPFGHHLEIRRAVTGLVRIYTVGEYSAGVLGGTARVLGGTAGVLVLRLNETGRRN